MRNRLLARHFLSQFVENDFAPDIDRHQVLALAAAGLITVPLFTTVFMSVKYLMQLLQTPAWTEITASGDQMIFCATSMIVSAIVATLEWDALALSRRDAMILGVLPVSHRQIVRAKAVALCTFAAALVVALNALPVVLHPPVMVANLRLNPLMLGPLMFAQGLAASMAGAFGFAGVLAIRESLYLVFGRRGFEAVSAVVRSGLLFSLLFLLLLVPSRPGLLRPVGWFAATHQAIAGRILDGVPRPDLPAWQAADDDRLVALTRRDRAATTARAMRGGGVLLALLAVSSMMYLLNARRLHVLPEEAGGAARLAGSTLGNGLARALGGRPARRAGLAFLIRTMLGNPVHRTYLIASGAVGAALWFWMAPAATQSAGMPVRTHQLAAQTLILTAMVAGFRAAIRTSSDARATWVFGVADTGNIAAFRNGVRAGVLTAVGATVLLLAPLHAAAWGVRIAAMHAVNGLALGWLLVEIACGWVPRPLVWTIPPSDGVNTVGTVFLGALVIFVFVLARIERAALASAPGSLVFAAVILVLAAAVRSMHERDHRIADDAA